MNILVVDDDKVDRLFVRELLDEKFKIFEAQSEREACEVISSQQVDCVLLDYLIPGTDTLALLGNLVLQDLPVIMMTGEGNEVAAVNAIRKGAQDYIKKSGLSDKLLKQTIERAVEAVAHRSNLTRQQQEQLDAATALTTKVGELQRINQELENSVRQITCEFSEPLKAITDYCDLLEQGIASTNVAPCKDYVAGIRDHCAKLAALVPRRISSFTSN